MQEKIVIYLASDQEELPSWVTVTETGEVDQVVLDGQPEALLNCVSDKQVIIVVPAQSVLLTGVSLPKMPRSRLLEALPFALEEHLVTEVERLHFATGERQLDETTPVAVVSKDQMDAWLSLLRSWHIAPHVMVSQVFALPAAETVWHLALADHAIVRIGTYQGFGCDLLNTAGMLTAALQTAQQKPERLYAYEYAINGSWQSPEVLACTKAVFDRRDWFVNSAQALLKTPYLNLLQGVYRTKQSTFLKKDKLRQTLLAFAVAWIGLLILYPTISYFILSQHASELSVDTAAIYHRYYPESKEVVAPKLRLEEKLKDLNSEDVDNQLLMMLAYLGQALSKTPPIELKRVDYQNNKMTVEFTAASSPDYAKFTGLLSDSGVRVKEQSANLSGKQILATIILEY